LSSSQVRADVAETSAAFARAELITQPERNEMALRVYLSRDRPEFQSIIKKELYQSSEIDGEIAVLLPASDKESVEAAMKIGPRVLARILKESCFKNSSMESKTPGALFKIVDNKIRLPSNLESAADSMVHKLMLIYSRLGIHIEVSDQKVEIPSWSQGWETHMSYTLDLTHKLLSNLRRPKESREMLPTKLSQEFGQTLVSVLVYKWANKNNLSAYLKDDVKKLGNLSEAQFLNKVEGWGTPTKNNLAGLMSSSIYQLVSNLANEHDLIDVIPRTVMLSGGELRRMTEPSRQIVEKSGKTTKIVKRGEINVLRFDNIRFLMPSERMALKKMNESADVENHVREFDALHLKDRNYPQFVKDLKEVVAENSARYFYLRRLARQRLYAIKEVRREAKQPDQVNDSDFTSNEFIASVCKQAEAMIIDLGRRRSVLERLRTSIVLSGSSDQQSEGAKEVN